MLEKVSILHHKRLIQLTVFQIQSIWYGDPVRDAFPRVLESVLVGTLMAENTNEGHEAWPYRQQNEVRGLICR